MLLRYCAWIVAAIFLAAISEAQSTNGTSDDNNGTTAASIFVSPAVDMAFGINIPEDSPTDLFFTLQMPIHVAWAAVGFGGGTQMAGSLILMIYSSASRRNVTLSTRIASGHSEPMCLTAADIRIEALPGTGLANNDTTYVFNGRCSGGGCRARLDDPAGSQRFIYATGPNGDMDSDDVAAPLKRHWNYGSFEADLVRATGPGGVPVITAVEKPDSVGTRMLSSTIGTAEAMPMAHAAIMVFCFVGVYPFGILVLRLGNWVRWHAVNQAFALVLFTIGAGLGIKVSYEYNRSKHFNSAHQVIGILIFIFIYAQFALGFVHHRMFKKTQQQTTPQSATPDKTKPKFSLAPIHVWMGRVILVLGVANAFIGFPLALSPQRNYILLGLVIFVFPMLVIILLTKEYLRKRFGRDGKGSGGDSTGFNLEPWRQAEAQGQPGYPYGTGNGTAMPMQQYPMPQNPIVSDVRSYANYHSGPDRRADLGPQQVTREYV